MCHVDTTCAGFISELAVGVGHVNDLDFTVFSLRQDSRRCEMCLVSPLIGHMYKHLQ